MPIHDEADFQRSIRLWASKLLGDEYGIIGLLPMLASRTAAFAKLVIMSLTVTVVPFMKSSI